MGIATQQELILRLLPYLQWVSYRDLRTSFWKHITDQHHDGPLRYYLVKLERGGFIEKKYQGDPPSLNSNFKPTKYLYVRRVKKSIPRTSARLKKLDGTYGIDAEKRRARRANNPKRQVMKSMSTLTAEDVAYIREKKGELSTRAMAQMFNQHMGWIQQIANGYTPAHLRALPSQ